MLFRRGLIALLLLVFVLVSFSVHLHFLSYGDDNVVSGLPVYRYVLVFETTSDHSRIVFLDEDPIILAYNSSLVEGAGAPGLNYHVFPYEVYVSKTQYDSTRVVLRVDVLALKGSDNARLALSKGAIGYTLIRLLAWNGGGFTEVWKGNFTSMNNSFILPLASIYNGVPIGKALYEDLNNELPPMVLAFYYPWYGTPWGRSGGWHHWSGGDYTDINGTPLYPLLGIYDSSDPRLVRAQMALAKASGIDGFIVSWWGPGSYEDRNMPVILDEAARYGLKIAVYLESQRPWDIPTVTNASRLAGELVYAFKHYASHPAYLRVAGKPVAFVYAADYAGRGPGFWRDFWNNVTARYGRAVIVGDVRGAQYLNSFDGFHSYIELNLSHMKTFYNRLYEHHEKYGAIGVSFKEALSNLTHGGTVIVERKLNFFTVIPGYNDTEIRKPGHIVPYNNGDTYRAYWNAALDSRATHVLVTSWNEYHEGTAIEPTRRFGYLFLGLTRHYSQQLKNTTLEKPGSPDIILESARVEHNHLYLWIRNNGNGPAVAVRVSIKTGAQGVLTANSAYWQPSPPGRVDVLLPILEPGESYRFNYTIHSGNIGVLNGSKITITYYSLQGDKNSVNMSLYTVPVEDNATLTVTKSIITTRTFTSTVTSATTESIAHATTETTTLTTTVDRGKQNAGTETSMLLLGLTVLGVLLGLVFYYFVPSRR